MAAVVHTYRARDGNCQIGQNCQSGQKFLLTVGGGRRQVRCGQISLATYSKANGLNEAIPSQVWCKLLSSAKGEYETILDCSCLYSF